MARSSPEDDLERMTFSEEGALPPPPPPPAEPPLAAAKAEGSGLMACCRPMEVRSAAPEPSDEASREDAGAEAGPRLTAVEERIVAALPEALKAQASRALLLRTVRSWAEIASYDARLKKTLATLEHTVRWRRDLGVDDLTKAPSAAAEAFHRLWSTTVYGRDAAGRLVYVERIMDIDAEGIHGTFNIKDAAQVRERDRCRAQDCEVLEVMNARRASSTRPC